MIIITNFEKKRVAGYELQKNYVKIQNIVKNFSKQYTSSIC